MFYYDFSYHVGAEFMTIIKLGTFQVNLLDNS